ncbi:sigma 54-interacting transcriptional regulator [Candidatus Poribacteria bacterium]|nr:sigma 54-interacting transcriptional regulator [Candidatus Poribacteria bacterium]
MRENKDVAHGWLLKAESDIENLKTMMEKGKALDTRSSESHTFVVSHEANAVSEGQSRSMEIVVPKRGVWQTYDVTDGLAGQVTCMRQDGHGYLWIGTYTGLCCYNGAEFTTYTTDDGLANNRVQVIYEDRQVGAERKSRSIGGRLWFGTPGGVSCYNGETSRQDRDSKQFVTYTINNGLADNHVWAICEDRHGCLWFGTQRGVSCFDGHNFTTYTTDDGLAHNRVRQILEDRRGWLWFATGPIWPDPEEETGWGVTYFDGRCFVTYTTADGLADNNVRVMCEDRGGHIWFSTPRGVSRYSGDQFVTYTTADGLANNDVRAMCEDRQGRLWFGTMGGVSCVVYLERSQRDGGGFRTYTTADGLAGNQVGVIYEDRQGRLWFSDSFPIISRGTSCFNGDAFTTYTAEDGLLDSRTVLIFEDREGHLWLSHLLNGLSRFDPETVELLTTQSVNLSLIQDRQKGFWFGDGVVLCHLQGQHLRRQTFNDVVFRILEDSRGNLWVGTVRGDGLYRYASPDAVWRGEGQRFTMADGLGSNDVYALLEGRDGTLWVGTAGNPACLCRFDGEVSSEARARSVGAFEAMPTPHRRFWHLFEDRRGRIWMSDWSGSGLSCYDGKKLTTYTTKDGLPSNHGKDFLEDDSGNLWIGTWEGLCRFDGERFVTFGRAEGLKSLFHDCLAKDARGHLWFGTLGGGLYRTDGRHFQQLTDADGLPSNNITGLIPQPDGSMIIGTTGGIVRYRPTATLPPPIDIREVVADQVYRGRGEAFAGEEWNIVLTQQANASSLLTISYHGLSFATRQMRYSYILEGYDKGWKDTWENQVRYENLPVGEYAFKVIAINRDLVESVAPATLKLTVVPDPRNLVISTMQTEIAHLRREVEMPNDAQVHLLRVLQERTVIRIGEFDPREVDVRIIAITNRDLEKEVGAGRFRADLYHRLKVFPIHVPPLRERTDDIPLLAEHFLQQASQQQKKEVDGFGPDVFEMLSSYSWPGNIRELENEVYRAVALVDGGMQVQTYHFSSLIHRGESLITAAISEGSGYAESVKRFQRRLIEQVLNECGGNRHEAARRLKMYRPNLIDLIKRLGIKERET